MAKNNNTDRRSQILFAIHNATVSVLLFLFLTYLDPLFTRLVGDSAASRLLTAVDYVDVTVIAVSVIGLLQGQRWGLYLTQLWAVMTIFICVVAVLLPFVVPLIFETRDIKDSFDQQSMLIMYRVGLFGGYTLVFMDAVGTLAHLPGGVTFRESIAWAWNTPRDLFLRLLSGVFTGTR